MLGLFCLNVSIKLAPILSSFACPTQAQTNFAKEMCLTQLSEWARGLQDSNGGTTNLGVHLNSHEKNRCDLQ